MHLLVMALLCSSNAAVPELPNLVAKGIDVEWHGSTRKAKAYVENTTSQAVGPFKIIFYADQNHVSQGFSPQISMQVDSLASLTTVQVDADFTPLATSSNSFLSNVKGITLKVDPGNHVSESNENDNVLITQLPQAQHARFIYGPGLQTSGNAGCLSDTETSQTFRPDKDMKLMGIEFSTDRAFNPPRGGFKISIFRGQTQLLTQEFSMENQPFGTAPQNPPAISGYTVGPSFIDLHTSPITLLRNRQYRFAFSNPSQNLLRIGMVTNSVVGTVFFNSNAYNSADIAFKLYAR